MTTMTGKCSWFGGPNDTGVAPDEELALCSNAQINDPNFKGLFLRVQPANTTGCARRLDPDALYCAMRWDYGVHPRSFLIRSFVKVTCPGTGKTVLLKPCDWGPNGRTDRIIDMSPGALKQLGIETDWIVTVEIPDP